MPASVTVAVPARLHLGFLDLNGGIGRRFGGIGLAVDGLRTKITITKAPQLRIDAPDHERAARYLETMRHLLDLPGKYRLQVDEAVPPHAGLGSGTQLALAIAAGLRQLHDLPLDVESDAIRLGRGARSGVGIGLFHRGGIIVDAGRGPATKIAPIVSHMSFPLRWRILLLLDPACRGVHGEDENAAFAGLPPFPDHLAAHLCRLVLMQALPAVAECDLASFGAAIRELQAHIGDYFAPRQGGRRFSSPAVGAGLHLLDREGAHGIGQSSWGPTGFAFAASPEDAHRLVTVARNHPGCRGLDIRVCAALNRGADIKAHAAAGMPAQQ
jgi:beta-ribofuranosylaminobenzene 5'-phosphate synthase